MKSVKVADYMSTRLITFNRNDSVVEAMAALLKNKISGAPVVDDDGNLIGILSEKDLMAVVIQDSYYDEADSDILVEGAIGGMLRTLDPHSHYLNRRSYRSMREEQQGSFSGLGIVIQKLGRDRPLTVISPIYGTPAARLASAIARTTRSSSASEKPSSMTKAAVR